MTVSGSPGLKWRNRNGARHAYWIYRSDERLRSFRPRTQLLWTGEVPTEADLAMIASHCVRLQDEMRAHLWTKNRRRGRPKAHGGLGDFVACGAAIKIGITTNLEERLEKIQMGCPFDVALIGTVPGDVALERQLHWRFRSLRIRGEWFKRAGTLDVYLRQAFLAGGEEQNAA